ncbi:MAG: hypothetical protein ACD_2C00064G0008 [uncultured bacterium (gcode 4)]|uniref:Uncharacterized protein n=1 Tax=uncultured bacterium (gcode 4) TaxID=1234023 RepID=K2FFP7_9BACT|nr:MAG: hypothetical protein ACD_2C00064G0008 [uncultured bacterium (gcode 4)]
MDNSRFNGTERLESPKASNRLSGTIDGTKGRVN